MVVVLCHAKILFEMTNNSFYCSSPTTFLSFHLFLMQRIALTRRTRNDDLCITNFIRTSTTTVIAKLIWGMI